MCWENNRSGKPSLLQVVQVGDQACHEYTRGMFVVHSLFLCVTVTRILKKSTTTGGGVGSNFEKPCGNATTDSKNVPQHDDGMVVILKNRVVMQPRIRGMYHNRKGSRHDG